jgi:hypothetical protein
VILQRFGDGRPEPLRISDRMRRIVQRQARRTTRARQPVQRSGGTQRQSIAARRALPGADAAPKFGRTVQVVPEDTTERRGEG